MNTIPIHRKFFIFFFITAILPLVLFSTLFLESIFVKQNQRLAEVLESALWYLDNEFLEIRYDLQADLKSLSRLNLTPAYEEFSRSGSPTHLEQTLKHYHSIHHPDILIFLDPNGKTIQSLNACHTLDTESILSRFKSNRQNKSTSGFQRFINPKTGELILVYVYTVPVPTQTNGHKDFAMAVAGRRIREESTLKLLFKPYPEHLFRVFIRADDQHYQGFVNDRQTNQMFSPALREKIKTMEAPTRGSNKDTLASGLFEEWINGRWYYSRAVALKNFDDQTIAYIVVSLPKVDFKSIARENLLPFFLFLLLLTSVVLLAGKWFKADWVDPMNQLNDGLKRVLHGDLKSRVKLPDSPPNEALQALETFNSLMDKLEESEALRSTFISTLSHDLKTPLLAQKKVIQILESELQQCDNDDLRVLLAGMRDNNAHLVTMITTLLETYQYEAGRIRLKYGPVDLHRLFSQCFVEMESLAQENNIHMIQAIEPDFPPINGDFLQLKRVFSNLIINAIQNNTNCQIRVSAELTETRRVIIRVEDTGQGIPEKSLPYLFDRHYTGHKIQKRIGSGLGLYICKMIIDLHQGIMTVASTVGEGTCFTITLDLFSTNDEDLLS